MSENNKRGNLGEIDGEWRRERGGRRCSWFTAIRTREFLRTTPVVITPPGSATLVELRRLYAPFPEPILFDPLIKPFRPDFIDLQQKLEERFLSSSFGVSSPPVVPADVYDANILEPCNLTRIFGAIRKNKRKRKCTVPDNGTSQKAAVPSPVDLVARKNSNVLTSFPVRYSATVGVTQCQDVEDPRSFRYKEEECFFYMGCRQFDWYEPSFDVEPGEYWDANVGTIRAPDHTLLNGVTMKSLPEVIHLRQYLDGRPLLPYRWMVQMGQESPPDLEGCFEWLGEESLVLV